MFDLSNLYYLYIIPVLGFMILIHEFGHYAVAKWLGVRVEQFAIGFGKRLIGFRKGETDYRINAIPLGGYVKMSGENPMDERSDDPREFMNHSRWHRFLIAIAGPTMNILLAIVLLTDDLHGPLRVSGGVRRSAGDRMGGEGYAGRQGWIPDRRPHYAHRRCAESQLGAGRSGAGSQPRAAAGGRH